MRSHLPADTRPPPASSFGRISIDSVTTRLVVIMVAIFILDRLLYQKGIRYRSDFLKMDDVFPLIGLCHFSIGMAVAKWEVWRVIAWPFVHFSPWHLLINLASLHCFGPVLESHFGSRRFLIFYMLCGLGGIAAYVAMWGTNYLVQNPLVPMYSASAPVLGLLVAAAHVAPDATATIYDLVPVRLRNLALALLGLALLAEFRWGGAALLPSDGAGIVTIGGAAAHLGGGIVGFLLIRTPQWVRVFDWRPFNKPPPF